MMVKIKVENMEQTNAIMALVAALGLEASIDASKAPEKPAEKAPEKAPEKKAARSGSKKGRYDSLPAPVDTKVRLERDGLNVAVYLPTNGKARALRRALREKCGFEWDRTARKYAFADAKVAAAFWGRQKTVEMTITAAEIQAARDAFAAEAAKAAARA